MRTIYTLLALTVLVMALLGISGHVAMARHGQTPASTPNLGVVGCPRG